MVKRTSLLFLFFFFLFSPYFLKAEILVRIGVFDLEKLKEDYPEARQLKENWEKFLNKKYFYLPVLKLKYEAISRKQTQNIVERINKETEKILLKKQIEEMELNRKNDLEKIEELQGREIRRKILLAIRDARRKKGIGIVLSKEEQIYLYDERLDFNALVLEELMPKEKGKR